MESFILEAPKEELGGTIKMPKVLIASLYSPDPVLLAATRLGAERLILFIDKKPNEEQEKALKVITQSLGRVLDVKEIKADVYNVVEAARKCVEVIDLESKDNLIYINITSGRKPLAIGLLLAAYARSNRVKKIAYNPDEDKSAVVYLPKLSFRLTVSQKQVLETLEDGDFKSLSDLADKVKQSRAMLYRNIKELEEMDLITTQDGFKLTDAGRIARL
ncbi:CRISPR locus-related DNA-binding protein [Candidatus Woesearchaeota archaeon]|nr:CRISPR locus-related DNA-binding protein [Candidatus Woesearchaeota archaeon]